MSVVVIPATRFPQVLSTKYAAHQHRVIGVDIILWPDTQLEDLGDHVGMVAQWACKNRGGSRRSPLQPRPDLPMCEACEEADA